MGSPTHTSKSNEVAVEFLERRRKSLLGLLRRLASRSLLPEKAMEAGKVILASSLGTVIDYYDLFIVSTASSLVWPHIFFVGLSPGVKAALSLVTFGIIYVTRPIGALIFGYFGDKIGRRDMLAWTLVMTAIGVGGIAVLPTAYMIGTTTAVSVIIALRMLQGIGLGGEWAGASAFATEFVANSRHRAFLTGWIQNGVNIGILLASGSFAIVSTVFTHSQLLNYAWRIPFAVGAIIIILALFIRLRIAESPLFQEVKEKKMIEKDPIVKVFKEKWKTILLLLPTAFFIVGAPGIFVSGPYIIDFVTHESTQISDASISLAVSAASASGILATVLGSLLGDRIGRRTSMILSSVFVAIFLFPFYLLVRTLSYPLIVIGLVLLNSFYKLGDGVTPALFSELFTTRYRYTGAGIAYQFGSLVLGILSVSLIPLLIAGKGLMESLQYIIGLGIATAVLTAVTTYLLKETKGSNLSVG